jgi:hypothetical protein
MNKHVGIKLLIALMCIYPCLDVCKEQKDKEQRTHKITKNVYIKIRGNNSLIKQIPVLYNMKRKYVKVEISMSLILIRNRMLSNKNRQPNQMVKRSSELMN